MNDSSIAKYLYYNKIKSHLVRKCYIRLRLDKACSYSIQPILCDTCNKEINTKYIIMECDKTKNDRKKTFDEITKLQRNFGMLSSNEQLKYLLNITTDKNEVISKICSYIKLICTACKII